MMGSAYKLYINQYILFYFYFQNEKTIIQYLL